MENYNHYRYSFENQFFQFLNEQTNLTEMITNLYELEEKARNEFAESHGLINEIENEELQEKGLCFRYFDGDTSINTIRNLETDLSNGSRNKEYVTDLMFEAISLASSSELQIFFA